MHLQRIHQRVQSTSTCRSCSGAHAALLLLRAPNSASRRRQLRPMKAEAGESTPPAATSTEEQQKPQQPIQQEMPKAPSAPLLAPGQGTAIVTGAISVIFGIAYLVLVSLLDMRGGELQPPPPEAFMQ